MGGIPYEIENKIGYIDQQIRKVANRGLVDRIDVARVSNFACLVCYDQYKRLRTILVTLNPQPQFFL